MEKTKLQEKLKGYCIRQNDLSNETIKLLIEYVNANGGEIDTSNEDKNKDNIYAFIFDEGEDRYKDYKVDKVKVDDGTLLVHVEWDYYNDEDENWYSVEGGMVIISPTLYNLCECLPEYID